MCNCGKHRCPVHRPQIPFEGWVAEVQILFKCIFTSSSPRSTSTTRDAFREWPLEGPRPSPARAERAALPFEGTSRYREDYPGWEPEAKSSKVPAPQRLRIPFEGESTSAQAFKEWPLQARAPAQSAPLRASLPFEGTTEARTAFSPPASDAYLRATGPAQAPERQRIPFEGESTSAQAFKEWPLEARSPQQPKLRASMPDDRDFRSETLRQYTPKHVDVCPASRLPPPPAPSANPAAYEGGHLLYDRRRGQYVS